MKPGYYLVLRDAVLTSEAQRSSYRLRLERGAWVVTDGLHIGRFDQEELDWLPLEWSRGYGVLLDTEIEATLSATSAPVPFVKLEREFQKLVFVEPGEVMPEMPRPPLKQLGPYLRRQMSVTAYTYQRP